ncbi:MAG TPA: hypothetical protein VGJ73_18280 [Verrucomicrobiae bacterium]
MAFLMQPLNAIPAEREPLLNGKSGGTYSKFNGRRDILSRIALILGILVSFALPSFAQTNAYTFDLIAGNPTNSGTANGAGSGALFNGAEGTAVDTNYVVFVADTGNNEIRRIVDTPTNWVISGLAGTNYSGSLDGGYALFNGPQGITVDLADNVYVADTLNNEIRKISFNGTYWNTITIAGTNSSGSANGTNRVARFDNPEGIAVDTRGNLYVADTYNDTIRKIVPLGTNWVVTTIAGTAGMPGTNDGTNSLAQFTSPEGIAVDNFSNVFVADTSNDTIRVLSPVGTNWVVSTIAGLARSEGSTDASNKNARFYSPGGIAVDASDNLYVTDSGNDTVRKIVPVGTNWIVSTIGGLTGVAGYASGTGTNALFTSPKGIAVDPIGDIYVDENTENIGSLAGGVDLLGELYGPNDLNTYYIIVNLGPAAATSQGGAWTLSCHPGFRESAPDSTEDFSGPNMTMEFVTISGWNVPTNQNISLPPNSFSVVTNLYYTTVAPVLSITHTGELTLTGTLGTTYTIQSSTSLFGPWSTLVSSFKLTTSPKEIEQISPWPDTSPSVTYYRALWSGD